MRQARMIARWGVPLVLALALTACQAGQNGADALAFIRGSELFRLQPDGSGLYQVTPGTVAGFAWSPDHHEFVARFAAVRPTPAASPLFPNPAPDMFAALGVISIDGGNILPITPTSPIFSLGDAWWDASGNRLFYREHDAATGVQWILSQSDQPDGIARKTIGLRAAISPSVPNGAMFPTSAPDGSSLAWVTATGDLDLAAPGGAGRAFVHGALSLLPSGAVARPLWQPRHRAILYASAAAGDQPALLLADLSGATHPLATIAGLDGYSWSPDGTRILTHAAGIFRILDLSGATVMQWPESDVLAVPWWSPDSREVLIESATSVTLATLLTRQATQMATLTGAGAATSLAAQALPITGSPWSGDGQQFALVAAGGAWHTGAPLATRHAAGADTGLYIVSLRHLNTPPSLVDWGEHTDLSWSTPDPNTLWLTP